MITGSLVRPACPVALRGVKHDDPIAPRHLGRLRRAADNVVRKARADALAVGRRDDGRAVAAHGERDVAPGAAVVGTQLELDLRRWLLRAALHAALERAVERHELRLTGLDGDARGRVVELWILPAVAVCCVIIKVVVTLRPGLVSQGRFLAPAARRPPAP